ncbi:hypothetical protein [Rhodoblastus sp.]|uniref:hypothetical protein n=1 Tax=Rhodoblastus sp. TaxID=1962975 RepID=UPI003F996D76
MLTGTAIVASILSYAPLAEAAPIVASPSAATMSSSDGPIVQVLTRAGVAHRSTRRTARRVYRR